MGPGCTDATRCSPPCPALHVCCLEYHRIGAVAAALCERAESRRHPWHSRCQQGYAPLVVVTEIDYF